MEDRRQLDGGGENEEFVRDEELVGGVVELTLVVLLLCLSIVVYFSLYVFNFRITESYVVIFLMIVVTCSNKMSNTTNNYIPTNCGHHHHREQVQ